MSDVYSSSDAEKNQCFNTGLFKKLGIVAKCNNLNCPTCRDGAARKKVAAIARRIEKSKVSLGHRSFIIHIDDSTTFLELRHLKNVLTGLIKKFDRSAIINFVLHSLPGNRHFNVGIASKWLNFEQYIGFWDCDTKKYVKSGTKHQKYTYHWLCGEIEKINLPYVGTIVSGFAQFWDNHIGWLEYVLRANEKEGYFDEKEIIKGCTGHSWRAKKKDMSFLGSIVRLAWSPSSPDHVIG